MLGGILTNWYQSRNILGMTRAWMQKQMEERLEKNEKDIRELKDVTLELSKSIERLAEELRENNVTCRREESATSEGSVLKMKGKMEEDSTAVERGTWEQALKWAANCKLEVDERGETPWTWEHMQKWIVDCKAKRIERSAKTIHQTLSEGLQREKERAEKKLEEIKVEEKQKWNNDLKMKESKNDHEKDEGKRKPNLTVYSHGRRLRVRWSETNTWWKWKHRAEKAEAWERRQTLWMRRKAKKRLRKRSLILGGSEENKKKNQTVPIWNKSTWIRSVKIEETAHWSGNIERLIIYIGQDFVEVRYFPCLSFVACELYQSREGMRKLGNEEDE